jgi:hypothetical protein
VCTPFGILLSGAFGLVVDDVDPDNNVCPPIILVADLSVDGRLPLFAASPPSSAAPFPFATGGGGGLIPGLTVCCAATPAPAVDGLPAEACDALIDLCRTASSELDGFRLRSCTELFVAR